MSVPELPHTSPASTHPQRLRAGRGPYGRSYRLVADELVVHFDPETSQDVMDGLLGAAVGEGEYEEVSTPVHTLAAGGLRRAGKVRIRILPGGRQPRDAARTLEGAHEVLRATPVYRERDGGEGTEATPVPDTLLVEVQPARRRRMLERMAPFEHAEGASALLPGDWELFRLPPDTGRQPDDGFELLREVGRLSGVKAVEFDWLKLETYAAFQPPPNDEYWPHQQNLRDIGMLPLWQLTGGEPGVRVVVIDSGFDLLHPDIRFDDPANHRNVEALWGFAEARLAAPDAGPGRDPHGTSVAGIVGACTNNPPHAAQGQGLGVASVAGACGIVPVKIGEEPTSGRVAAALGCALDINANDRGQGRAAVRVVNMSLSTVPTSALVDAVDEAAASGLVLVAATGSVPQGGAGRVGFPARHPGVIGVGACDGNGDRVDGSGGRGWFSAYGCGLDVVAPGVDVWTTDERGLAAGYNPQHDRQGNVVLAGPANGDYVDRFDGTSAAAPHVAGLAALLLAARPNLSAGQVRNIIERSCRPPGDVAGARFVAHPQRGPGVPWSPFVGCGVIDAAAALARLEELAALPEPDLRGAAEPCTPVGAVILEGEVLHGPGDLVRIHDRRRPGTWIEISERDILGWPCPPAGGSVRVRPGAPLRRVMTTQRTPRPARC